MIKEEPNTPNPDRLYDLLPVIQRQRDAEQGWPLRALLRVIAEQVDVVEADMDQLYENWFIETCEDWVVPYIGDLIGYRLVHEAGEPGDPVLPQSRLRNKILIPRREVANTIAYRRRKGTLALLELLAHDVAGWPARTVEFYRLLGWTQALNHLRPERGRTVDLRSDPLALLDGPFDELAHTVDVRRIHAHRRRGWHNIPSVGLFVWRLRAYSVTQTPAYCLEQVGPHCYTFSVLGNAAPLYTKPEPEPEPTHIAGELNLPVPIRRKACEADLDAYYGPDKSFQLWRGATGNKPPEPIPAEQLVIADLSRWQYRPRRGQVAVDPELGRIAFPPRHLPKQGVWVSYHYGFSADVGGGEYERPLSQPDGAVFYQVGNGQYERIGDALKKWQEDQPQDAVIEITRSGVYVEQLDVVLQAGQTLQIRAANRVRPVIRLLDYRTDRPDALHISGEKGSRFTMDGLLIGGRGVHVTGEVADVVVRHSTLVPGWGLHPDCEPKRPAEPSLELLNTPARVRIERSIIGSIQVNQDEVQSDPIAIRVRDSVLDGTSREREAVGAPAGLLAHAVLTIERSTVFGQVRAHAIELAENSIFMGRIKVGRRQRGCMRFCYVIPGSRTPRRYRCQPDLVKTAVADLMQREAARRNEPVDETARQQTQEREAERVRPRFNSRRYGTPTYCQLALTCAEEIRRGADDESEVGVFHHLYQPQREANLRARLDEYTPAGMEAGIIFAS
ncbi:MAG: hypothetical protein R6X32_20530 [Chloroflexota bacterium]